VDQRDDGHVRVRGPASARLLGALALLAAGLLAAGCQFPRDVEGTLQDVRGGVLHVGVTEHEPWVSLRASEPSGVEVGLIREFAARLDARVDYTQGSEEELAEALHRGALDVVIGGISDRTQWRRGLGMTKPYLTTSMVVGMPPGRELRDGERIVTEAGTEATWLLEKETGAIAVPRESLEGLTGRPAVVDEWLLDDLGLERSEVLDHTEHVMLTTPGENAFLVELEHFLLERKQRALRLLEQEGRP
jgi:polar amino acid transport system substrate-binding protein